MISRRKLADNLIGNPVVEYKVCLITVGNLTHLKRGERLMKLIVHIVLKKPFTLFKNYYAFLVGNGKCPHHV